MTKNQITNSVKTQVRRYKEEYQKADALRIPYCPYCGKRLNPLTAWSIKSKGEYLCSHCKTLSDVKLNQKIYLFGWCSVLLGALFLLILFLTGFNAIALLFLIPVPFLLFTISTPLFVQLKKMELPDEAPSAPPRPREMDATKAFSYNQKQ